jgi:hypothetical protein
MESTARREKLDMGSRKSLLARLFYWPWLERVRLGFFGRRRQSMGPGALVCQVHALPI